MAPQNRGANLPGRVLSRFSSALFIAFSTAVRNLLSVHVLLGGYSAGARVTPTALYRL